MQGECELLDEPTAAPARLSAQEVTAASLKLAAATVDDGANTWRSSLAFVATDSEEQVRAWVRERLPGCELPGSIVWLRLFRDGDPRGVLAVLHGFVIPAEMELLIFADRGAFTRSTLNVLAGWIFRHVGAVGLLRLVVRLPEEATEVLRLARRAGFRDEGRARDHFAVGRDALVLAMTRTSCPWLLPPLPDAAEPAAPSTTRH